MYSFILVVLLIILIARGEVQGDVQSWCIAASNAWGLFVLTVPWRVTCKELVLGTMSSRG